MGTMRPNKYDVTTVYRLCEDFVPPDGGDGSIKYNFRHNLDIGMLRQSRTNGQCRTCFCFRPASKSYAFIPYSHLKTWKYYNSYNSILQRAAKVHLLQQKMEISRTASDTNIINSRGGDIPLEFFVSDHLWRLIEVWHAEIRGPAGEMKKKRDKRCYFQETLKNGNFQYQSIIDGNKFIGFRKNGKPIHYDVEPKNLDANCLSFLKLDHPSEAHSAVSQSEMLDDARVDSGTSHSRAANKRKQLRRQEAHRLRVNQIKHISQKENTGRFEKKVARYSAQETTSNIPPDSVQNVRSLEHRGREVMEKRHRHRKGLPHRHVKHHSHSEPEKTHFSLEQYSSDVVRSLHNDAHRHSGSKHNHRKV